MSGSRRSVSHVAIFSLAVAFITFAACGEPTAGVEPSTVSDVAVDLRVMLEVAVDNGTLVSNISASGRMTQPRLRTESSRFVLDRNTLRQARPAVEPRPLRPAFETRKSSRIGTRIVPEGESRTFAFDVEGRRHRVVLLEQPSADGKATVLSRREYVNDRLTVETTELRIALSLWPAFGSPSSGGQHSSTAPA